MIERKFENGRWLYFVRGEWRTTTQVAILALMNRGTIDIRLKDRNCTEEDLFVLRRKPSNRVRPQGETR